MRSIDGPAASAIGPKNDPAPALIPRNDARSPAGRTARRPGTGREAEPAARRIGPGTEPETGTRTDPPDPAARLPYGST
jgi:hypothetical protein